MAACVCYEMLVGCAPFYHEDEFQTNENIQKADYRLPPDISDEARDLLSKMLVKDQEKRLPKIKLALLHPWITKYASKEENDRLRKSVFRSKKIR